MQGRCRVNGIEGLYFVVNCQLGWGGYSLHRWRGE